MCVDRLKATLFDGNTNGQKQSREDYFFPADVQMKGKQKGTT